MKRRSFVKYAGVGIAATGLGGITMVSCNTAVPLRWKRSVGSQLFDQLVCDGKPLAPSIKLGVLNAKYKTAGSELSLEPKQAQAGIEGIKAFLQHRLHSTNTDNGEDLLEGTLSLQNTTNNQIEIETSFTTGVQPSELFDDQKIYIPISATSLNRDKRLKELGTSEFYQECEQKIGQKDFACHYLEPAASNPKTRKTKALLLAPVLDIQNENSDWKVALITPSEEAYEYATIKDKQHIGWRASRQITLLPGEKKELKCWLLVHKGDAQVAWDVFHKVAHYNEFEPPQWLNEVKVHYYDFLSSANGKTGLRGDGYEADIPYFNEFRVGLATQHGYYPYIGDFISPDRKEWFAMQGDVAGPAKMSLNKMRERINATRKTGAKAGIYMHTVLFDEASPLFNDLRDSILIDEMGEKKNFSWKGPDTVKQNWWMSFASEQWTNHLLKQAEYIMEFLNPDAIVFDETFVCLGYEHHTDRRGALSPHSIKFFKELRRLVHSYGDQKAVLTSDCGGANMVMWADGDAGDHSYGPLLGNPLYRKEPIRYKAAIGDKPWVPCSWHFLHMWEEQMDLARKLGTSVGVSNGWIEYNGLKGLSPADRERILKDIMSL